MPRDCRARLPRGGLSFIGFVVMVGACSSESAVSADAPEPTLASLQTKVFGPSCAEPACHGADFPKQGVALYDAEATQRTLVRVRPTLGDAATTYPALVLPGSPDRSFLIAKVSGPAPGHGLRMPSGGAPLPAATVDAMRRWIASMPP